MPKSPHFIRIKADVLRLVDEIPFGRVTTYGIIGTELDVMARHVAYILAMLSDEERAGFAWYRVVGDDGILKSTKKRAASQQRERLESEGITFSSKHEIQDFEQVCYHFSE